MLVGHTGLEGGASSPKQGPACPDSIMGVWGRIKRGGGVGGGYLGFRLTAKPCARMENREEAYSVMRENKSSPAVIAIPHSCACIEMSICSLGKMNAVLYRGEKIGFGGEEKKILIWNPIEEGI